MTAEHERLERLHGQLRYDLGPVICMALEDESVTEIKVGDDGKLWLRKHEIGWENQGITLSPDSVLRVLNVMASLLGKTLNAQSSLLSGELPLTGDRVEGSVPPSSRVADFVIRTHAPRVYTFDEYVAAGILTRHQVDILREHILRRSNFVVSGPIYSGKTTLLNACLHEIIGPEHVLIVEDTYELQCPAPNVTRRKGEKNPRHGEPSLWDQLNAALRLSYDRLIVGETRDKAAHEMLKAWDTGARGGMTTLHATSAVGVFERLAQLCQEAGVPPQWRLMRSAIDLIVHMEMTSEGRRVTEILEVGGEKRNAVEGLPDYLVGALVPLDRRDEGNGLTS